MLGALQYHGPGVLLASIQERWSSEECSLLQQVRNFLAGPIYIPQRKMCARIRITKELMDDYDMNKGYASSAEVQGLSPIVGRAVTLKLRLDAAVVQAKERLRAVEEARDIFNRNPDLEKLLNIMQKGLF